MEIWKEVVDNPNYIVSNTGYIRRKGRDVNKGYKHRDGYMCADLYQDNERQKKRIHRVVAEAFIPNPDNKPDINHKDGNKLNNHVDNLEWVTKLENNRHGWGNGLITPSRSMLGRSNPNAGRKGRSFRIVETGEVFGTMRECEEKTDCDNRHINDCLRGRQKTHRGYHFEYV